MAHRFIPNPSSVLNSLPLLQSITPKKPFSNLPISLSFPLTMSWTCSSCTFLNPPSQKSTCQICITPPPPPSSSSSSSSNPKWACKACTFFNSYSLSNCEIGDTRASFSSLSSFEELDPDHDLGGSSSVGSVFSPLRRCNTGKNQDPDGFRDLGVKEKGQNGDYLIGKGQVLSDVELSASRNSASKRKYQDLVSEQKVGKVAASGAIKILTYNVWFREDLEMHKRMQAIGDLIQQHSPDIICFQEVTPNIYDIFQKSAWWKKYCYSVSYERATSEVYFCMQLAKLPVKSFICRPFSYTTMGRELCITEIETNSNKSLVIATSHLESPCPGPPTWDQMFSKERVNQANEAVSFLQKYRNAIFCGDMNWDDILDGQFPFVEGWFDAWEKLRPSEIGWTYDTKSNKMLSGNRALQKRLDRFICKLPDFDVSCIDMIGTEAISGLTYNRQKKMKNKIQELSLPVLPSDHYGLLLTITNQ